MSIWLLYVLIVLIPGLATFFAITFVTALFVYLLSIIGFFVTADDEEFKTVHGVTSWIVKSKLIVLVLILSAFLSAVIPGQKQVMYITGGYIATNSEQLAKLPNNLLGTANKYLEKYATLIDDEDAKEKKESKKK